MAAPQKKKKTKRGPGRPYAGGGDKIRSIRVPDAEWDAWKKAAEGEGITLAEWLRRLANQAC